jgi:hypothetical protein
MAGRARPTSRCLREDLALAVPRADTPLEEISHPLLARATERFADDQTPHGRIAAIDDEVLFKVKAQRWRGAVWVGGGIPWLVAPGGGKRDRPTTSLIRSHDCGPSYDRKEQHRRGPCRRYAARTWFGVRNNVGGREDPDSALCGRLRGY